MAILDYVFIVCIVFVDYILFLLVFIIKTKKQFIEWTKIHQKELLVAR